MILEIDLDAMPKSTREKMEKAIKRIEQEGRQANRVAPLSFRTTIEVKAQARCHRLGLERIFEWASPTMRDIHKDAFLLSVGRNVCGLLLNERCDLCPAKKHKKKKDTCQRILGTYAMHKFEEEDDDDSGSGQKSTE